MPAPSCILATLASPTCRLAGTTGAAEGVHGMWFRCASQLLLKERYARPCARPGPARAARAPSISCLEDTV
eukprot:4534307-Prymnesium_polylepis.1